jgi:hypothetical protein
LQLLHPVATHSKLPLSFVTDVTELQSAWERSGKFEGDIILTEEQMRHGLINTASRWRNRQVRFFIDHVFSEYCCTKIISGVRSVEGIIHKLRVPL